MGITMYNGLRKTRDVTKDSPKQITEIVTFVKDYTLEQNQAMVIGKS